VIVKVDTTFCLVDESFLTETDLIRPFFFK
jgi:hypothetical protein